MMNVFAFSSRVPPKALKIKILLNYGIISLYLFQTKESLGAECIVFGTRTYKNNCVQVHIARAVETIRVWNATMTQARALEAGAHQPGRHMSAGKRLRKRLAQALRTLALFEIHAQALGIPIEALYTACGGRPVIEPEDAPVRDWRSRITGAQLATPSPASVPVPPQDGSPGRLALGMGSEPQPAARGSRQVGGAAGGVGTMVLAQRPRRGPERGDASTGVWWAHGGA